MSIEETRIEEVEDDDDDLPELEDAPAGAEPAGGDDDVPAEMAGTRKNQSRAEKKARKVRPRGHFGRVRHLERHLMCHNLFLGPLQARTQGHPGHHPRHHPEAQEREYSQVHITLGRSFNHFSVLSRSSL